MEAVGLVEVTGSSSAIMVVDQMVKAADVDFETWHTKCGGHVTVFLSGSVSSVQAAIDVVKRNPPCPVVNALVISAPSEETTRLVEESKQAFDKKRK